MRSLITNKPKNTNNNNNNHKKSPTNYTTSKMQMITPRLLRVIPSDYHHPKTSPKSTAHCPSKVLFCSHIEASARQKSIRSPAMSYITYVSRRAFLLPQLLGLHLMKESDLVRPHKKLWERPLSENIWPNLAE